MRCECGKPISRHMRGKCMACRYREAKENPADHKTNPLYKTPRILIPVERMPYRGEPTRNRAFDGNMQKVLFEKELL